MFPLFLALPTWQTPSALPAYRRPTQSIPPEEAFRYGVAVLRNEKTDAGVPKASFLPLQRASLNASITLFPEFPVPFTTRKTRSTKTPSREHENLSLQS